MHTLKKLSNGFEYIEIKNSSAIAKVALNGAHVLHYEQNGKKPLLWLSEISELKNGSAIRGGIPICWPWFGTHENNKLPKHGFARTSLFELTNISELDKNTTQVSFRLQETIDSRKFWDYKFTLELKITVSNKLTIELKTTNTDTKEFKITQAIHSYFLISDISKVSIKSLDNKKYLDALTMKDEIQDGKIIFDKEIDRVYQGINSTLELEDEDRKIHIDNEGSSSCVVWNPWIEKCSRMSDMKDDAYKEFVCVESANAFDDFKIIKPNESHTLKATLY